MVSKEGSFKYWVITKSSNDKVIEIKKPEKIPGIISGITTFHKACIGVAPKSKAAS